MDSKSLDRTAKLLFIVVVIVAFLILCKDILLPIAFAFTFSAFLFPIYWRVNRIMGRVLSIFIVLLGSFIIVGLLMWLVVSQLTGLIRDLPSLELQYEEFVTSASYYISDQFQISTSDQASFIKEGIASFTSSLGQIVVSTTYLVYFFIQVPIYVFLILLYRDRIVSFFYYALPQSDQKWLAEIQGVVWQYISGLTIVVLIAGVLNSLGMYFLGIKHAFFFGFLSGMLTLIPYVGIAVGASIPTLVALVTKDSIWYAVGVVAIHSIVQMLEGNFISPKVTGSKISINAFAAIIVLFFGQKIWGIAGMILAVPALGVIKILLSYSTFFKPLVVLIGNEDITVVPSEEEEKKDDDQK